MPLPEQRRPPCTRLRERYESTVLLLAAQVILEAAGWRLVMAAVLPRDELLEAVYER